MLKTFLFFFIPVFLILIGGVYCYSDLLILHHEPIRNIGLAVAALIGFPLIAWRTHIANQQTKISNRQATVSEANHVSDMYASAIEQIGSDNKEGEPSIELRIGGLYALEQIASKNTDYHQQIMEVLSAYIRLHANSYGIDLSESPGRTREDIKVALKIIGRRNTKNDAQSPIVLSKIVISGIDLRDSDFSNTEFIKSSFFNTSFSKASLRKADFRGSGFINSVFDNVDMNQAKLEGTKFTRSQITNSSLTEIKGQKCEFVACIITDSKFDKSKIMESKFNQGTAIQNTMFTSADITKADFTDSSLECFAENLVDTSAFDDVTPPELAEEIQKLHEQNSS